MMMRPTEARSPISAENSPSRIMKMITALRRRLGPPQMLMSSPPTRKPLVHNDIARPNWAVVPKDRISGVKSTTVISVVKLENGK